MPASGLRETDTNLESFTYETGRRNERRKSTAGGDFEGKEKPSTRKIRTADAHAANVAGDDLLSRERVRAAANAQTMAGGAAAANDRRDAGDRFDNRRSTVTVGRAPRAVRRRPFGTQTSNSDVYNDTAVIKQTSTVLSRVQRRH